MPYINLIAEEKYEEAYSQYTSASFKKKYPLQEYIEAQKKNKEQYGVLQKIESDTGILNEITEIGTRKFYHGIFRYTGCKGFTYIAVDIVKESNRYEFDRTYEHRVAMNMNSEQIF